MSDVEKWKISCLTMRRIGLNELFFRIHHICVILENIVSIYLVDACVCVCGTCFYSPGFIEYHYECVCMYALELAGPLKSLYSYITLAIRANEKKRKQREMYAEKKRRDGRMKWTVNRWFRYYHIYYAIISVYNRRICVHTNIYAVYVDDA